MTLLVTVKLNIMENITVKELLRRLRTYAYINSVTDCRIELYDDSSGSINSYEWEDGEVTFCTIDELLTILPEPPSFDTLWTSIESNFDFKKVHKIMVATNWIWASCNGVPSIEYMKEVTKDLCEDAYHTEAEISTGGFTASCPYGELKLTFNAEIS